MLSVIIATFDSERALVPTLAALIPGATAGLITEVVVADGGSSDDTASVADAAGCNFMFVDGALGGRLKAAAGAARAPWLLFLRPGTVLDSPWIGEIARFIEQDSAAAQAAVFRPAIPVQPVWRQVWHLLLSAPGTPRPEQGLLLANQFYQTIGGHSERAGDPEADLLRRIGRRRLITLSTAAFASS